MKLFTCIDHDCHYPVGVASVVIARDEKHARQLMTHALIENGLNPMEGYTLIEIDMESPQAIILQNGDY